MGAADQHTLCVHSLSAQQVNCMGGKRAQGLSIQNVIMSSPIIGAVTTVLSKEFDPKGPDVYYTLGCNFVAGVKAPCNFTVYWYESPCNVIHAIKMFLATGQSYPCI